MFCVTNMSDIRQQWQVRLSTSMMKHYSIITEMRKTVVNFMSSHFTPGGKNLIPTYYEVGCATAQVWTFWRRKKSLAPNGNQTLDHAACNPVHQAIKQLKLSPNLFQAAHQLQKWHMAATIQYCHWFQHFVQGEVMCWDNLLFPDKV
jgi:hypothetical protein